MHSSLASLRLGAAALATFVVPSLAHAHITLTDPPPRNSPADQKNGPCGKGAGDSRTTDPTKITEYTAGETITIAFTETIQHASTYRVMLSSTGDGGFIDPTGYEDTTLDEAAGELADGIEDLTPLQPPNTPEEHTITVTLPNEPCEECTLQLIQVMRDKPPFTAGGDDIYYQCADIVILPGADVGSGGASAGGASGSGGADVGSGGVAAAGGTDGSGGTLAGSGGALVGSGGVPSSTGGAAAGGAVGAGGLDGSGGGGVTPPAAMEGCAYGGGAVTGGAGTWLGLAGLGWLAFRRRRARA